MIDIRARRRRIRVGLIRPGVLRFVTHARGWTRRTWTVCSGFWMGRPRRTAGGRRQPKGHNHEPYPTPPSTSSVGACWQGRWVTPLGAPIEFWSLSEIRSRSRSWWKSRDMSAAAARSATTCADGLVHRRWLDQYLGTGNARAPPPIAATWSTRPISTGSIRGDTTGRGSPGVSQRTSPTDGLWPTRLPPAPRLATPAYPRSAPAPPILSTDESMTRRVVAG